MDQKSGKICLPLKTGKRKKEKKVIKFRKSLGLTQKLHKHFIFNLFNFDNYAKFFGI